MQYNSDTSKIEFETLAAANTWYRALEDAHYLAHMGHWTSNIKQRQFKMSASLCKIFGIKTGIQPKDYEDMVHRFVHPEDQFYVREYFRNIALGRDGGGYTYRIIHNDGTVRWLEAFPSSVMDVDSNGSPTVVVGAVQDITERREFEDRLRYVQKMESVGTIAGGVAHDFNNILYAMSGYINLVKEATITDKEVAGYMKEIELANVRAMALVKQILAFSRTTKMKLAPVMVHEVVQGTLDIIAIQTPEDISSSYICKNDDMEVLADRDLLAQAILNIMINGVQAMKGKNGILSVTVTRETVDAYKETNCGHLNVGDYARVSISDEGVGIDPPSIYRIFEPFFTTRQVGEGSGLGLAIVFGVISALEGAVEVHSEVGQGSMFHIYIPLNKRPSSGK